MFTKIDKFFDLIINFLAVMGRIVIIIISLLIITDIVALKFFNYSFSWIMEVSEYLLVMLTFLGVAWLLKEDGHIKLDLLINRMSKRDRRRLEILNTFLGAVISLVITVYGFIAVLNLYERGIKTETILEIPRYLLILIIPISFIFVFIQFIRNLFALVKKSEIET